MSTKIICFIDNSKESTKGIFHCFGQNEETSTNEFCKTFLYKVGEFSFKPILGCNNQNYLFISSNETKLVTKLEQAPSEWAVLLVHDSVKVAEIVSLLTSDTLILYHGKPENAKTDLMKYRDRYKYAIRSVHEKWGKYALLFEITQIWRENDGSWGFDKTEFDRVIGKIADELYNGELEAILAFLHGCLMNSPSTEEYQKLEDIGINTKMLSTKLTGDCITPEYETSLATLRDELLKLVL